MLIRRLAISLDRTLARSLALSNPTSPPLYSPYFPSLYTSYSTNKHMENNNTKQLNQQLQQTSLNTDKTAAPANPAETEQNAPKKQEAEHKETKPNKKQKKPKEPKEPKEAKEDKEGKEEDKNEVGPKLFSQIDIRIANIVECWKHPESENLYCEKIDLKGEARQIASGLQKFVPLQKMTGKVIIMANLKPRPLAGFLSNGMVVCASTPDHTAVELLIPEGENGERLFLEGHEELFTQGDIQPILNPKKKVLEKCVQHFKTDEEGFVVWKGIKLMTKAGPLKATTIKAGNVS